MRPPKVEITTPLSEPSETLGLWTAPKGANRIEIRLDPYPTMVALEGFHVVGVLTWNADGTYHVVIGGRSWRVTPAKRFDRVETWTYARRQEKLGWYLPLEPKDRK